MTSEVFDKFTIELDDDYGTNHRYSIKVLNNNAKKLWNAKVFWELYRKQEDRDNRYQEFKKSWTSRMEYFENKKQEKKSFQNPAKVGDILYSSWGYDQTNIDFYQVVKVSGKTIKIREIKGRQTESTGFMTGEVVAVPDSFVGNELKKIVKPASDGYAVTITSYADAWKWDGSPKSYSSYA